MKRLKVLCVSAIAIAVFNSPVNAAGCPSNPDAIGTSRTITIDPIKLRRIGTLQYPTTLPLKDREIVLTFDDGPFSPSSIEILDILASQCVRATFFVLGKNASDAPDIVKRAYADGHTIGTHTQTHPYLSQLTLAEAKAEIQRGIASAESALGEAGKVAPFFRAPYLDITEPLNGFLVSQGLMLWGIDFQGEDWLEISSDDVIDRVLRGIEEKRKGVLLLHDIQERTAEALPKLLMELKKRGYKIVHAVPASKSKSVSQAKK